jgi:hypothetical protein
LPGQFFEVANNLLKLFFTLRSDRSCNHTRASAPLPPATGLLCKALCLAL